MKMVVSIMKVSGPTGTKTPAPAPNSVSDKLLRPQSVGSQRLEKPQIISNPISILMQPVVENEASISIHRVEYESDEMFTDYIRRVREKRQNGFLDASNFHLT
ncbi:hypothetical protein SLE2022_375800 [Rubroshorea leprosula]